MKKFTRVLLMTFSPLTILAKMFSHDREGVTSMISLTAWMVMVSISWVVIPLVVPMAVQVISTIFGYPISIFLYSKIERFRTQDGDDLVDITLLLAALIAGFTLGTLGHLLFL